MNLQLLPVQNNSNSNAFPKGEVLNKQNDSFRKFLLKQEQSSNVEGNNIDAKPNHLAAVKKALGVEDNSTARNIHISEYHSLEKFILGIADSLNLSEDETANLLQSFKGFIALSGEESDVSLTQSSEEDSYLTSLLDQLESIDIYQLLNDLLPPTSEKEQLLEKLKTEISKQETMSQRQIAFSPAFEGQIVQAELNQTNRFTQILSALKSASKSLTLFEESGDVSAGRSVLNNIQLAHRLSGQLSMTEWSHVLKEANLEELNESKLMTILENMKRVTSMGSKSTYASDSSLTTKDLKEWLARLESSLNLNNANFSSLTQTSTTFQSQSTLSEVEQYILHVGGNDNEDIASSLSKLLNRNRFFQVGQMLNGNQLTLHLRPENLGEMVVRFQQVDGETMVKLIVASEGAKRLLESNMSQLKNMFSPHQVTIESREESTVSEVNQEHEEMREENSEETHEEHQEKQQNEKEQAANFKGILDSLYQEEV